MIQANPEISSPVKIRLAESPLPVNQPVRLRARWISLQDLSSCVDAWTHLENNAIWRNPSFEHNYLIPAIQNLGTSSVRVLVIEDETADQSEKIVGLLPIESKYIYKSPFKCAEVWKHEQCFDATPLLHNKCAAKAWRLICTQLATDGYSLFNLNTVSAERKFDAVLRKAEHSLGVTRFQRAIYQRAAFVPAHSAELYVREHVSKSIRKNTQRMIRRLADIGTVTWEISDENSNFESLAEDFLRIESSGWKGEERTALASSSETKTFYEQLILESAKVGKARFLSLKLDGKTIAMLSDIQSGNVVYSYKTAYDDAFAKYSPGQQVEVKNLEFLHRDGIELGDSCTAPNNSTINRIWGQKLSFQNVIFSLKPGIARMAMSMLPLVQSTTRRVRKLLKKS